jgi:hypothetical protein
MARITLAIASTLLFAAPALAQDSSAAPKAPKRYTARYATVEQKAKLLGASAPALQAALTWLAAAQGVDGSWEGDGEATALALLALMSDGSTSTFGEDQEGVFRAVKWLLAADLSGVAAAQRVMALADHQYVEGTPLIEAALAEFVKGLGPDEDPRVCAWNALAIAPALQAEVQVVPAEVDALRARLREFAKNTGEVVNADKSSAKERLTAGVMLARHLLGDQPDKDKVFARMGMRLARKKGLPSWESIDMEYAFLGTYALQVVGGEENVTWWKTLERVLIEDSVIEDGAWVPSGATGAERVKATAFAVLALSANLRYRDVAVPKPAPGVIGIGGGAGGKFGGRFGGARALRAGGAGTEKSLADALTWLIGQQADDGSWPHKQYPTGVTGLSLLALLGDGSTLNFGPHKSQIGEGIKWLREQQNPTTGAFAERRHAYFLYEHAIATQAMCEAYYFSKSPILERNAQKAVDYILAARNPGAGWRYSVPPDGKSDVSMTCWMLMALVTAQQAGLSFDAAVYDEALLYLDSMTDPTTGRVGYDAVGSRSARISGVNDHFSPDGMETMTALALITRILVTQERIPLMSTHADLLAKSFPREWSTGQAPDMIYLCFGSYGMYQLGGSHWKGWNITMKKAVVGAQVKHGDNAGSWDPSGPWGMLGGRTYSTAMMALTLEVYTRYSRLLGR